eukprot:4276270-Prymnesium_polylepis.1
MIDTPTVAARVLALASAPALLGNASTEISLEELGALERARRGAPSFTACNSTKETNFRLTACKATAATKFLPGAPLPAGRHRAS